MEDITMLKGQRIGLRSMRSEDTWLLYKWYNDRRVTNDLGSRTLNIGIPIEEMRWRVEKALDSEGELHFIIVTLADQRAIGSVSLRNIDQRSAAALERAHRHFTWEAKAAQIREVYDWVLSGKKERPPQAMPIPD
jgi:RimJ/RimL family protein N-acetyltransferase